MNTIGSYLRACNISKAASDREDGVMYSEPEIRLAEALTRRGLPFVQQQRLSRCKSFVVADFFVADSLIVEVDGRAYHRPGRDAHRDYDIRREHDLWTLRIPARHVMADAEACVCLIALKLSELELLQHLEEAA